MGDLQKIVREQIEILRPDSEAIKSLHKISKEFIYQLNNEIRRSRIDADVFVGGSFAKGTQIKSGNYDVDIFVRFDWKYESLSEILEKIIVPVAKKLKMRIEKVHGSRDYFRVLIENTTGYFEVIPVMKIKKPREERNVTDLTYFHGPYVKKRISGLEDQVRVAKQFMKACEVYGAETYVRGFSGYSVELLILKYKSLVKMLRELIKVTDEKRLVIDLAKHYSNPKEVFIQLNEAKVQSPIILIDPTYKERNALAALSQETFAKFQKSASDFLKNPGAKFFEKKNVDINSVRVKSKAKGFDFVSIHLDTDKQPGDIAGTKLKKFFDLLLRELESYFVVKDHYFRYNGEIRGISYIIAKAKKEIVRIGPPIEMKHAVKHFKERHAITFVKGKHIHAHLPVAVSLKAFLDSWVSGSQDKMKQMHITRINVED
ncbi:MAG: nucleotidyltransferase domain-containing protein [Nanoarchaeota archaeon]